MSSISEPRMKILEHTESLQGSLSWLGYPIQQAHKNQYIKALGRCHPMPSYNWKGSLSNQVENLIAHLYLRNYQDWSLYASHHPFYLSLPEGQPPSHKSHTALYFPLKANFSFLSSTPEALLWPLKFLLFINKRLTFKKLFSVFLSSSLTQIPLQPVQTEILSFLLLFAFRALLLFPSCKTPYSLQMCFNITICVLAIALAVATYQSIIIFTIILLTPFHSRKTLVHGS